MLLLTVAVKKENSMPDSPIDTSGEKNLLSPGK